MNNSPTIYYINMERDILKNGSIIEQLNQYNLKYKRVNAIDGKQLLVGKICKVDNITYLFNRRINKKARGCLVSHFKTYNIIYEDMLKFGTENAIVCEDDISFELVNKWKEFTNIEKVINDAPSDWEIIKLNSSNRNVIKYSYQNKNCYTDNETLCSKLYKGCNSSTLIYIINKKGIQKIRDYFYKNGVLTIDMGNCTIDYIIWEVCKTYNYKYPLFVSKKELEKNKAGIKSNNFIKKIYMAL